MFQTKQNFHPKNCQNLKLLEDELVVPAKYIAKGPKKRLEVLKNELDKRAIKLSYMKLDIGVIMQKKDS